MTLDDAPRTKLFHPKDYRVSKDILDTLVRLGIIKSWDEVFTVDHSTGEIGLLIDGKLVMIDY